MKTHCAYIFNYEFALLYVDREGDNPDAYGEVKPHTYIVVASSKEVAQLFYDRHITHHRINDSKRQHNYKFIDLKIFPIDELQIGL